MVLASELMQYRPKQLQACEEFHCVALLGQMQLIVILVLEWLLLSLAPHRAGVVS